MAERAGGAGLQVTERIVRVLKAFSESGTALGVSELARRLELPKSVVHRTLTSLVRTGFLQREEASGRYRLGPEAIGLGLAALGRVDLVEIALPHMEVLRSRTGETVTLSVRVGSARVYVAQLVSPQDVKMTVEIGRRWPLYAGASGRAMLAMLPPADLEQHFATVQLVPLTDRTIVAEEALRASLAEVRAQGYAVSLGERDPWAGAVAAAVITPARGVLGAVSVCGPLPRFTEDRVAAFVPALKEAVQGIGERLGAAPHVLPVS